MKMNCKEFYRRRDRRTVTYLDGRLLGSTPIEIELGPELGHIPAGQLLLLALANQAARVHRRIHVVTCDLDAPLLIRVPFARETLEDTLRDTVAAIDPCGEFSIGNAPLSQEKASVGVGSSLREDHDWYVGASGAIACLNTGPVAFDYEEPATLRGAALASCLAEAALFRTCLGLPVASRRLSAWNLREGDEAEAGPSSVRGVDVGRVLMVGAGAVGGALAYWLHAFGVEGDWSVIDKDRLELHNTNRHMLASASQAGWEDGELRDHRLRKSELASRYLPGTPDPAWYGESQQAKEPHDLALCLANDRDVRTKVAQRNAPVVLHATTGRSWLSQLHRHVAGQDDCIRCRMQDVSEAQFECSTAEVPEADSSESGQDAALPFLSAASGLMLTTALQRLQEGVLLQDTRNDWRWDFASEYRMSSGAHRSCRSDCRIWRPPSVRKKINEGSKWAHLDQGHPP